MKDRIILAAKGFLMGLADVVPGVSGGTMALILGIYTQFIDALRSVNLRFLRPLGKAIKGGFKREARADLMQTLEEMQIGWLMTLAFGILSAVVIGSRIIPSLLEDYPEIMNAFFFGLILASVWVPYAMLTRKSAKEIAAVLVAGVAAFVLVGASFSPPMSWRTVEVSDVQDGGQTMKQIGEAGPSAITPRAIYEHEKNAALQAAVPPEQVGASTGTSKSAVKKDPINEVVIPAGTPVEVPMVAAWFMFLAGFIAISAMLLPGLSGSFLLLTMGSYYFVLNALKGTLRGLVSLDVAGEQIIPVTLFCLGCLLGLVVFSRFLSWLLHNHPDVTLSALIGVMLGCLRTIWPFKGDEGGDVVNVLPASFGSVEIYASIAFIGGFALVVILTVVANKMGEEKSQEAAA